MSWYTEAGPDSDVIISSRVRLARNLETLPFPHRMSRDQAREAASLISERFFDSDESLKKDYLVLELDEMSQEDQMALVEKRLISEELVVAKQYHKVMIRRDESVSIMINEEDHIRIQSMRPGLDLEAAYRAAETAAIRLEEQLPIAYSDTYGFLTACPTNTGTGMRSSVMAHLPALTMSGVMRQVAESLAKMGFVVRGLYGEHSKSQGNLYQISNQLTLGSSETELISDLKQMLQQIIEQERHNRRVLHEQSALLLENRVMRAYGILRHARLMPSEEAFALLSDLRLGIALGIIDQVKTEDINRMQSAIGPASIQKAHGRLMTPEERDQARAETIRSLLNQ